MKMFTDAARIYLNDVELIFEAREEFSNILANWWEEIVIKSLLPKLNKLSGIDINSWDNRASPGMIEVRAVRNQSMLLKIVDPRHANRPCYTVSLHVGNQGTLKSVERNHGLKNELDHLATIHNVGHDGKLKWTDTCLATTDTIVNCEKPEETRQSVCDNAVRFFELVLAHHKHNEATV